MSSVQLILTPPQQLLCRDVIQIRAENCFVEGLANTNKSYLIHRLKMHSLAQNKEGKIILHTDDLHENYGFEHRRGHSITEPTLFLMGRHKWYGKKIPCTHRMSATSCHKTPQRSVCDSVK